MAALSASSALSERFGEAGGVSMAASSATSVSATSTRYDSLLADTSAFNRRLRKGRIERPPFFDTATHITQRPAPWLHRTSQARVKGLPFSKPQFLLTYRRHRWRIHPDLRRRFADNLENSSLLFMFQTIPFPTLPNPGLDSSPSGRGQQLPRPSSNSDYSKHQASISLASETGNSLTGSVSGECSQHSNSNTATTTTTTTATATHRERRMSPGVVMLGGDYQDSTPPPPPHTNTTMEETADDDDSSTGGGVAASKLKFKRRMLNIAADKAGGVVRRYHQKRLGVAGCARQRGGRRGHGRWASVEGSSSSNLQGLEAGFEEDSQDSFSQLNEAVYRSNANLASINVGGENLSSSTHHHQAPPPPAHPPQQPPYSAYLKSSPSNEDSGNLHNHHHYQHQSIHPPPPSQQPMMQHRYHQHQMQKSTQEEQLMQEPEMCGSRDQWRTTDGRMSRQHAEGLTATIPPDMSHSPVPPSMHHQAQTPQSQAQSGSSGYPHHHPSPLHTPPHHQHQQNSQPTPAVAMPQSSTPSATSSRPDMNTTHGGGSAQGGTHPPPTSSGGASTQEPTTVVTFFVCEVCASRYRSTAGLRYHYHSQHAGYTPRNPISASASRISIPTSEYNRFAPNTGLRGGRNGRNKRNKNNYPTYRGGSSHKGRGLSAANQHIISQRNAAQTEPNESDPYHMPSANTPEDPHPRSVYSSSSEPQQTESSMSSVNSSSYISPIKLKSSSDMDYGGNSAVRGGVKSGGYVSRQQTGPSQGAPPPPPPPPLSSASQPPPYYAAPSALASMDYMTSSLLRHQQQQPPTHPSLLAQLQPSSSYKQPPPPPYGDQQYYSHQHQQQSYSRKPSFYDLRGMLRQRRAQFPNAAMDAFACGYCQMHVDGVGGVGGTEVGGSYTSCFGCGMPVHNYCILRYRNSGYSRIPPSQRLCYPWLCTECKTCWVCGSGLTEEMMITCCECDRGYHGYCLTGSVSGYQPPCFPDDWVCEICRQQDATSCLPPAPNQ